MTVREKAWARLSDCIPFFPNNGSIILKGVLCGTFHTQRYGTCFPKELRAEVFFIYSLSSKLHSET